MTNIIRYTFLFILICAYTIEARSQNNSFTLDEAIVYAEKNHKSLMNAQFDIKIANKKVKEILAIGLPQVSSDIKFQNFIQIPTTVIPAQAFDPNAPADALAEVKFGTEFNLTAGVQLSQLIFNGSYIVGLQATKAFQETTNLMMTKTKQEVRENVKSAYYTVVMLQNNSKALKNQLKSIEKIYHETEILVDEGVVEKTSPLQLKLTVIQMKAGMKQIDQQTEVAKILLKMNMGYDMEKAISLSETMETFLDPLLGHKLDTIISVGDNINHKLLNHQFKLDQLNLKNERTGYLPSLVGYISHQQNAQRNKFNFIDADQSWFPTTIWGLNLNIPIWTSGSTSAKIQQATLKSFKTKNSLNILDDGLRLQYTKALNDYLIAKDLFYAQKEIIEISKQILEASSIKFKEGVISSMEFTQSQGQLLKAEADIIATGYKILEAKLAMDKLSNKL